MAWVIMKWWKIILLTSVWAKPKNSMPVLPEFLKKNFVFIELRIIISRI